MPLAFQRPAQSIFSGRRMNTPTAITEPNPTKEEPPELTKEPEAVKFHDFLNFFPMHSEQQEIQKDREAGKPTPVAPLPPHRQTRQMRQTSAQQPIQPATMPQHFQQQSHSPHQRNMNPQQRQTHPSTPQHPSQHQQRQMQQPPMQPASMPQHFRQQQPPPQQHMHPPMQSTTPPQFQQQQWITQPPSPMQPAAKPQLFQHPPQQQPPRQMPHTTPPPTMPQATPPSPENAAAHFRNINKSLPDGVMYEPLDDETMRILKAAKSPVPPQPPAQNGETQQTPPPAQPTAPSQIAETLQRLAQNEHNAHIFYTSISHNAPTEATKKSLAELAKDSKTRMQKYTEIIKTQFNIDFSPDEKEINTSLPFTDAMSLAVTEENKSLTTLSALIDQTEGTSLERQIERLISKKVVAQQLVLAIYTTTMPLPRSAKTPPFSFDATL